MGAPALAPRRAPARAPASRKSSRPRRAAPNPALAGAALIPHAAVRTAGAVRDLSDSSLIVRLTAGRGWIAVLCALLFGIVALNVISLSINTTSGRVSQAIAEYERRNSALRAEVAEALSSSRVEDAATALGLAVPAPEDIAYVDAGEKDLQRLADALGGESFLAMGGGTEATAYDPAGYEAAPSPTATATPAPQAPASAAPAPAATAPPPSGGGSSGGVGL